MKNIFYNKVKNEANKYPTDSLSRNTYVCYSKHFIDLFNKSILFHGIILS